jgi:hypothetical protein
MEFVGGRRTGGAAGMSAASQFTKNLPDYFLVKYRTNAITWAVTHPKVVKILAGEIKKGGTRAVTARNRAMDAFIWGSAASGTPQEVPNPQAPEDAGGEKWWEQ